MGLSGLGEAGDGGGAFPGLGGVPGDVGFGCGAAGEEGEAEKEYEGGDRNQETDQQVSHRP